MQTCRHYVLGNKKFRCVITFSKGYKSPHVTAYLPLSGSELETKIEVLKENDLPFPGDPGIIKSVESECPGMHIRIGMELPGGKRIPWELWMTENDYFLFLKSPNGRSYYLKFDSERGTFRQAFPLFFGSVSGKIPQPKDYPEVVMEDEECAEITNILVPVFSAALREDGMFPSGIHDGGGTMNIRDTAMSSAGWAYSDASEAEKALEHLLLRAAPREGRIEEHGMLIWGVYNCWLHSGRDDFPAKFAGLLGDLAFKMLGSFHNGLVSSCYDGYWDRRFNGEGFSFSQNVWAVVGIDSCVKMAEHFKWSIDCSALREKREAIFDSLFKSGKFIRNGYFASRLGPDGQVQEDCEITGQPQMEGMPPARGPLNPDSQISCAWLWNLVPPASPEAMAGGNEIWKLWNQKWSTGGLAKYNVSSESEGAAAAPWTPATFMTARSCLLQNDYLRVLQIIDWGKKEFNGSGWSGGGDSRHSTDGILNWSAAEWLMMVYREGAGLYPSPEGIRISPHLPRKFHGLEISNLRFRNCEYGVKYHGAGCEIRKITFNGKELHSNLIPLENGLVEVTMRI